MEVFSITIRPGPERYGLEMRLPAHLALEHGYLQWSPLSVVPPLVLFLETRVPGDWWNFPQSVHSNKIKLEGIDRRGGAQGKE